MILISLYYIDTKQGVQRAGERGAVKWAVGVCSLGCESTPLGLWATKYSVVAWYKKGKDSRLLLRYIVQKLNTGNIN